MRSVYTKILLWCFATLALSLVALAMVSRFALTQMVGKGSVFDRINVLLLEQATAAYESGGPRALAVHVQQADQIVGGEHHLIDTSGKDLATGQDLSGLAHQFQFEEGAIQNVDNRIAAGVESKDRKYRLLVMANSPFQLRIYLPYYLPILAAVALLCWALASRIASPLRHLARTADRFGRGDLSVRANLRGHDEIGDLAGAFDEMAERIGTLVTAERQLLQDVSHELRSPLARMSFAAELIRTAPDRDAAVARLKKEIQRLTQLAGALIEATRAEGDASAMARESLRLDEVLHEVVQDCGLEADARGCRIALGDQFACTLEGDGELLRRAIENILRNAIRHTPTGSEISVNLVLGEYTARISIEDQGPGVPPEVIEKIFQPFFRVDDSRTAATGGSGLGLTIAHRAIALHRGRVWAENLNPGLRVSIEIPILSANLPVKEHHTTALREGRPSLKGQV